MTVFNVGQAACIIVSVYNMYNRYNGKMHNIATNYGIYTNIHKQYNYLKSLILF